jgi:hypothetical protein
VKRAFDSCQSSNPFDLKTYHLLWDPIQISRMLGQVQPLKLLYRSVGHQHLEMIQQACAMFQVKGAYRGLAAFRFPSGFADYYCHYHHCANSSSVQEPCRHLPFAPSFQVFCLFFD